MEKPDTIEVHKGIIPYKCDIVLAGELFTLQFNYNNTMGTFIVDLFKDGQLVCAGEPVVYGVPLWNDVYRAGIFPTADIIPLDPGGESTQVTFENLGERVLLMLDNGEVSLNE